MIIRVGGTVISFQSEGFGRDRREVVIHDGFSERMSSNPVSNVHVELGFGLGVRRLIIDGVIGARVGMSASRFCTYISMSTAGLCMGIRTSAIMIIMVAFGAS